MLFYFLIIPKRNSYTCAAENGNKSLLAALFIIAKNRSSNIHQGGRDKYRIAVEMNELEPYPSTVKNLKNIMESKGSK